MRDLNTPLTEDEKVRRCSMRDSNNRDLNNHRLAGIANEKISVRR
jgi:hypothetical protein